MIGEVRRPREPRPEGAAREENSGQGAWPAGGTAQGRRGGATRRTRPGGGAGPEEGPLGGGGGAWRMGLRRGGAWRREPKTVLREQGAVMATSPHSCSQTLALPPFLPHLQPPHPLTHPPSLSLTRWCPPGPGIARLSPLSARASRVPSPPPRPRHRCSTSARTWPSAPSP